MARVELNEEQDRELSHLVQSISSSDAGEEELGKIFQEAEEVSSGKGATLRNVWENDVSIFDDDQRVWHFLFILYIIQ